MALMDIIRGVIGGAGIQSVLESTGLADHVDALTGGDLGAGAEALTGGDLGAGAEALTGLDLGAGAEILGSGTPDIADSLTNLP